MSGYRERVVPDDGRNENRWVALFTAAVLLCGVVGIYLRQPPDTPVAQTPDLTPAGRQQLTNGCWLGPRVGQPDARWLVSLPANAIFLDGKGASGIPDCTTPLHWILMTP
ncbi:MAG: hypothetical protein ACRDCY_16845 [Aeromonas veronii]